MKTKLVNVMVMFQVEIPLEGDVLTNIQTALDTVNEGLIANPEQNNYAQIFTNNIEESDIVEDMTEFEIGDSVEVPDPNDSDIHNHSFVGTIIDFRNGNAVVEDGDGDCFEIEVERLTLI